MRAGQANSDMTAEFLNGNAIARELTGSLRGRQ
jgi:hypothetical protein